MYNDDDQIEIVLPMSFNDALKLEPWQWDELTIDDLRFDAATFRATVETWGWLRGFDRSDSSEDAVEARGAVMELGVLFIALNKPGNFFLKWFKEEDWSGWPEHETDESDRWAWAVLARARCAVEAMGGDAARYPIRPISDAGN